MHSKVLLYANDLKIFQPIRNAEDSVHLQKDLDTLVKWGERNRLPFNMVKCEKIYFTSTTGGLPRHTYVYTMGGAPLQEVDCVRNLGILIDRAVTFKEHIAHSVRKSKRLQCFIIRNSVNFKNTRTLEVLYYSMEDQTWNQGH